MRGQFAGEKFTDFFLPRSQGGGVGAMVIDRGAEEGNPDGQFLLVYLILRNIIARLLAEVDAPRISFTIGTLFHRIR